MSKLKCSFDDLALKSEEKLLAQVRSLSSFDDLALKFKERLLAQ
ncbi:hypothetical protein AVEN_53591-1, partial [Araneus ventricosus]